MAYELSLWGCIRGFYLCPHIQRFQNIICLKYVIQKSMERTWPRVNQSLLGLPIIPDSIKATKIFVSVPKLYSSWCGRRHCLLKTSSLMQWTTQKLTSTIFWLLTLKIGWIHTSTLIINASEKSAEPSW